MIRCTAAYPDVFRSSQQHYAVASDIAVVEAKIADGFEDIPACWFAGWNDGQTGLE